MYQLKELVNMAYSQGAIPHHRRRFARKRGRLGGGLLAVAASVVALVLGAGAVLELSSGGSADLQRVALMPQEGQPAGDDVAPVENVRQVLFHVTDLDLRDAEALFDDVEHMFETALLNGEELQVQMVVHGTGMDLVRADLAPFPNRIRELVHTYDGLRVTACGQSRARHEREEGHSIQLLPWVEEVESGVREAAQKQAEGWTYIRV